MLHVKMNLFSMYKSEGIQACGQEWAVTQLEYGRETESRCWTEVLAPSRGECQCILSDVSTDVIKTSEAGWIFSQESRIL